MSGPFRALRRRCTPSLKPMPLRWNPFVRATGHVRSIHRFGDGGLRFVRSLPLCGGAGGVRAIPVCSVSSASHEETASPFGARVFWSKTLHPRRSHLSAGDLDHLDPTLHHPEAKAMAGSMASQGARRKNVCVRPAWSMEL